ncbi:MAG: DegT/DnrJ/EryC1/StrS family aminotransferase [Bacteroidales bacterium]|nr:DegT/DnrJ/EryC1/StrS family aminotransferase [Candidatus Latescibacterota bacterium]
MKEQVADFNVMEEKDEVIGSSGPAFEEIVPIIRPNLPDWEPVRDRLESIYRSKMLTNHKTVEELEKKVADFIGVRNAVALSSCTSGLILLMKALGITGEVIVPSFTFSATGHAIFWAGAKPVFVDCSYRDWNISVESVLAAVSDDTEAILGVHIFGNPAPVAALEEVAEELGIPLIFDAAHGFGAMMDEKRIGAFGKAEVFSMSPTKLITGGEGGILTTDDDALAEDIRYMRNYGNRGDYDCFTAGLNARMPEFNAAMILESIELVDPEINERSRLAALYRKELGGIDGISFQDIPRGCRHSWKDFTIAVDPSIFGIDRDRLHDLLLEQNIQTRKYFYPPLHRQSAYKDLEHRSVNLTFTEWLTKNVLTLPLYSHLKETGIKRIAETIRKIHKNAGND